MEQQDDFVYYPNNRVLGVIDEMEQVQQVVEALTQSGVDQAQIDYLAGEQGLRRWTPKVSITGRWRSCSASFSSLVMWRARASNMWLTN